MITTTPIDATLPLAWHRHVPQMARELAALSRLLYGRESPPLRVGVAEQIKLRFTEVRAEHAGMQLLLRCAGHDYELQVIDPFIWTDYQGALLPEAPAEIQRALVQHSLAPLWRALELRFRASIELLGVSVNVSAWPVMQALGIQATRLTPGKTLKTTALLRAVSSQGWRLLSRSPLTPLTASTSMDGRVFCVSAHPTPIRINLKELWQIEHGDVLVMDTPLEDRYKIAVRLLMQGRPLEGFSATLLGKQLIIESISNPQYVKFRRRDWITSLNLTDLNSAMIPNDNTPANAPLPTSSIESVQVNIELELAQISMPISTFRALSVGQVFETSHDIDNPGVVLWCGGQRLGIGELVSVGDRLGVRIAELHIASNSHESPVAAAK